jgi:hypothetical protein
MNKKQFLINNLTVITATLIVASIVVYAQTWMAPTASPPGGNTAAPINVGSSNQVKLGGLGTGPLAVFGNAIVSGDLDVSGFYKSNGKSGVTRQCPAGQTLTGLETAAGIVTGGSCAASGGGDTGVLGSFGGMYAYTWHGPNCTGGVYGSSPNAVTGGYSCPAGFSVGSICYYGASGVPSMTVYYCFK